MSLLKWSPVLFLVGGTLLLLPSISPKPSPSPTPIGDVLGVAYAADRITQVAVLRELSAQPFDGATDDGRKLAGDWFNANRFRNRPVDFTPYTDAVAEAIAANTEADLAARLEDTP
jgi:hypothetical protein